MINVRVDCLQKVYWCEMPTICPYCGTCAAPNPQHASQLKDKLTVISEMPCCQKFIITVHQANSEGASELLCRYPSTIAVTLPDAISALSPRFVSLYNQAYTAEQNNHFELAGCGYRNATEVLIKDYAIKVINAPQIEVAKKTLAAAVECYLPNALIKNGADVIRILGNDCTHYEARYDGLNFNIIKKYVRIVISTIDTYLCLSNPPVGNPRLDGTAQN